MKKGTKIIGALVCLLILSACNKVEDQLSLLNPVFGDDALPTVLGSDPAPGQSAVNRSASVSVLFNQDIDIQKCIAAFSIQPSVLGFFEAGGRTMRFTPNAPFSAGAQVFTISRQCEDLKGRDLEKAYTASFSVGSSGTTISTLPTVNTIQVATGTTAACAAGTGTNSDILANAVNNGCTGNPTANPIILTFNEAMNRQSVEAAFSVSPTVSGSFTWSAGDTVVTFTPDTALTFGTRYTVSVGTSAQDAGAQNLEFTAIGSFVAGTLDSTPPTITNITVEQTNPPSADACVGTADDVVLAATGGSTTDVCVNIALIINFSEPMDQSTTAAAVSFNPTASAGFFWATTSQLVITPLGSGLASNTNYALTISTSARDLAFNTLQADFGVSFTTENTSPQIVAVGLEAHGAGCDAFGDTGGNLGFGAGNCWWDNSTAIANPTNYLFSGGNGACGVNAATDNFRLIFNRYMDPVTTVNALSLRRLSPGTTQLALGTFSWADCQAVAPFGCRALTVVYGESSATCGGVGTMGVNTLDLGDTTTGGADDPIYLIEVDTTARDVNGNSLPTTFSFAFEGN